MRPRFFWVWNATNNASLECARVALGVGIYLGNEGDLVDNFTKTWIVFGTARWETRDV